MASAEELIDKMQLFKQWLLESSLQQETMLLSLCQNVKQPEAAIRMKYGSLEAFQFVSKAFNELLLSTPEDFSQNWLGKEPEDEEQGE